MRTYQPDKGADGKQYLCPTAAADYYLAAVTLAAVTAMVTGGLITPDVSAITVTFPEATAVAKPEEETVAIGLLAKDVVHVTLEVMSRVTPVKFPVAVSCWVAPTVSLIGDAGVMRIEEGIAGAVVGGVVVGATVVGFGVGVGVGAGVVAQAATATTNSTDKVRVRP